MNIKPYRDHSAFEIQQLRQWAIKDLDAGQAHLHTLVAPRHDLSAEENLTRKRHILQETARYAHEWQQPCAADWLGQATPSQYLNLIAFGVINADNPQLFNAGKLVRTSQFRHARKMLASGYAPVRAYWHTRRRESFCDNCERLLDDRFHMCCSRCSRLICYWCGACGCLTRQAQATHFPLHQDSPDADLLQQAMRTLLDRRRP